MNTKPAPAPAHKPAPPKLPTAAAVAAEMNFQKALVRARARGGPARDLDALCCRPANAPRFFGEQLTRMTLGIERLLQKRAGMPGLLTNMEVLLFFVRGPAVAELFKSYDEMEQQWQEDAARRAYDDHVREVDGLTDQMGEEAFKAMLKWVDHELKEWHRLSTGEEDEADKRSVAGSEGSRVGWWLRQAEEIIHRYGQLCPDKVDPTTWAVWQFPVNDHLALMPAALEREGGEAPVHYAVKEARRARTAYKKTAAAVETAVAAAAPPPAGSGGLGAPQTIVNS